MVGYGTGVVTSRAASAGPKSLTRLVVRVGAEAYTWRCDRFDAVALGCGGSGHDGLRGRRPA